MQHCHKLVIIGNSTQDLQRSKAGNASHDLMCFVHFLSPSKRLHTRLYIQKKKASWQTTPLCSTQGFAAGALRTRNLHKNSVYICRWHCKIKLHGTRPQVINLPGHGAVKVQREFMTGSHVTNFYCTKPLSSMQDVQPNAINTNKAPAGTTSCIMFISINRSKLLFS